MRLIALLLLIPTGASAATRVERTARQLGSMGDRVGPMSQAAPGAAYDFGRDVERLMLGQAPQLLPAMPMLFGQAGPGEGRDDSVSGFQLGKPAGKGIEDTVSAHRPQEPAVPAKAPVQDSGKKSFFAWLFSRLFGWD